LSAYETADDYWITKQSNDCQAACLYTPSESIAYLRGGPPNRLSALYYAARLREMAYKILKFIKCFKFFNL
jgi:hypothetical protein